MNKMSMRLWLVKKSNVRLRNVRLLEKAGKEI